MSNKCQHTTWYNLDSKSNKLVLAAIRGSSQGKQINMQNELSQGAKIQLFLKVILTSCGPTTYNQEIRLPNQLMSNGLNPHSFIVYRC